MSTATASRETRHEFFRGKEGRRYWWHWQGEHQYVPALYSFLEDSEWQLLQDWYADTDRKELVGEAAVPLLSVLQGFVMGSAVSGIVQCGHYAGYSTLMLGFMLRKMGRKKGLFSVDIDPMVTDFTRSWVEKAGLQDYVTLHCGDSAGPEVPALARKALANEISMVLIDSSHQYAHTMKELDQWYRELRPAGLLFLHDCSDFAKQFDSTGQGGVKRALIEWTGKNRVPFIALNPNEAPLEQLTYRDGCGLGMIQKPLR